MEVCKGKDITVLYYTTLEPFDRKTLKKYCDSRRILIVEPEFKGTLLEDVYETFPGEMLQIEQVGFPREIFRNYGTYEEKMLQYGLTAEEIRKKLQKMSVI